MALNHGKLDERLVWRCRDPIMGMVRLCCQRWWDNHGETGQRLEGRVPVGDYPYCLPPNPSLDILTHPPGGTFSPNIGSDIALASLARPKLQRKKLRQESAYYRKGDLM